MDQRVKEPMGLPAKAGAGLPVEPVSRAANAGSGLPVNEGRGRGSPTPGGSGRGRHGAVPGQRSRAPVQSTLDAYLLASIPAPVTEDELEDEPQAADWHTPPPAVTPDNSCLRWGRGDAEPPCPIPRGVLESPYDSHR